MNAERETEIREELAIAQARGDGWRSLYDERANQFEDLWVVLEEVMTERDRAVELLREAAWMHGLLDPPHPDWSASEHEEAEEDWLLKRVHPFLILTGNHRAFLANQGVQTP